MALGTSKKVAAAPVAWSFASVFMHADAADIALMVLGLVGAVGDGLSTPMMLFLANRIFNDIGTGPDRLLQFTSKMNEVVFSLTCNNPSKLSQCDVNTFADGRMRRVSIRTRGTYSTWRPATGSWRS
jgi:hypothetical protein